MQKKRAKKEKISRDAEKLNLILIENFVKLQKAMTNITIKFDNLAEQISKLLQLFEISARSFSEKLSAGTGTDIEKDKEFLEKLNKLLEQNKVIAKGLTLMEEKMKERLYGSPQASMSPRLPPPSRQFEGEEGSYFPSSMREEKRTRDSEF